MAASTPGLVAADILTRRDEPLQQTVTFPQHPPSVLYRRRLFTASVKCFPSATQTFKLDKKWLTLNVEVSIPIYEATITFAVDGEVVELTGIGWKHELSLFDKINKSYANIAGQESLIRRLAASQSAWLTITTPDNDFRISVRLLPKQLAVFGELLARHDSL